MGVKEEAVVVEKEVLEVDVEERVESPGEETIEV